MRVKIPCVLETSHRAQASLFSPVLVRERKPLIQLPWTEGQNRTRWNSKHSGTSREGSLLLSTCRPHSGHGLLLFTYYLVRSQWQVRQMTISIFWERNQVSEVVTRSDTWLKRSYIRIWTEVNQSSYKFSDTTLRRANGRARACGDLTVDVTRSGAC